MSFIGCIDTAEKNGAVSPAKAAAARAMYQRALATAQANNLPDPEMFAMAQAVRDITKVNAVKRKQRLAMMQVAYKNHTALQNATTAKQIERHMLGMVDKVVASTERNLGKYHQLMRAGLEKYAPKFGGTYMPKADLDELVDESFQLGSSNNASANEIMTQWHKTMDLMRREANSLGASISHPRPGTNPIPSRHDVKLMRTGGAKAKPMSAARAKQQWVDDHIQNVDWLMMRHFNSGNVILPSEYRKVLEYAYDTIVTEGQIRVQPGVIPGENLASRLGHERFIHYKDADAWRRMNKKYGQDNAFATMVSYMQAMAQDLALLEHFGPSPTVSRDTLKDMAKLRAIELDQASPKAMATNAQDKIKGAGKTLDDTMFVLQNGNAVAGGATAEKFANIMAINRNLRTAAVMGSAVIAAIPGDLATMQLAKSFNKLEGVNFAKRYAQLILSSKDRAFAVQSGLVAENASTIGLAAQRMYGEFTGPQWSRRVADVSLRISGLSAHTQMAKWTWGMEMMGMWGRNAQKAFDDLEFKDMLVRNGITAQDWDVMRSIGVQNYKGAEFLRPIDGMQSADAAQRAVAEKFGDLLVAERKWAIIEAGPRVTALWRGQTEAGTVAGEILRSAGYLKNFPVTIIMMHGQRMMDQSGAANKAKYAAQFMIYTTIAGAFALHLQEAAKFNSQPLPDDKMGWAKQLTAYVMKGGGLGIFADFVFMDHERHGEDIWQRLFSASSGPVTQTIPLFWGNLHDIANGADTEIGYELWQWATQNMPTQNLWYTKAAIRHLVFDNVQEMVDPKAHRRWRGTQKRLREMNQIQLWESGEMMPDSLPFMP